MKPTDFSKYISEFISKYLPNELGASPNTISAYRDTFLLLLTFIEKNKKVKLQKLTLDHIKKETIIDFLNWIQSERKCSNSTRNLRLAAIHSFYKYLQYQHLDNLYECQRILAIKTKKAAKDSISYLSVEGIKLLLQQPDTTTRKGRRNLALLSLMYDTGARVQEMIDLTPSMLRLDDPASIKVIGKGNKARLVPMLDTQTIHLKNYLKEYGLDSPTAKLHPLFSNSKKEKLTRAGVKYIVQKYVEMARKENKLVLPPKVTCHSLRHSKAMHLLQAGVNLVYIRDLMGHVSVQTTEIYARADSKHKRIALEKAYENINPEETPTWVDNESLISWLKRF